MADVLPLGTNFDLGFQSDTSREEMNPRAAYRMLDYLTQMEAPLRRRGGWGFGSPDLSNVGGAAGSVSSVGWLPFAGDGHLVAVSDSGSVYQVKRFDGTGGRVITDTGDTTAVPTWPVFWHKSATLPMGIVLGGLTQSAKPPKKYYDLGSLNYAVAPLGGAPPHARMGFSWGDYLVLGNYYDPSDAGKLKNYRWAFSTVGAPESWDLAASTQDFPEEMVAGIPVQNAILGFGYSDCHIITGDTPPPGGNLARHTLFAGNGTMDGRSVVGWRQFAIWANNSGVWMSDGATLTDLAAAGGISVYYRQKVDGLSFVTGGSACGGLYRDHYVLSLRTATGVQTTLACDIDRKVWTEWTNVPSLCFARRASGPGTAQADGDEELFFANATAPLVGTISPLWSPSLSGYDADGVAVLPVLETPFYRIGGLAEKRVRLLYAGYDLRDGGAVPKLGLSFTQGPEAGASYTPLVSLPATTSYRRRRVRLARHGLGFGIKIAQVGASADTRLYSIEAEAHPWEATRAT